MVEESQTLTKSVMMALLSLLQGFATVNEKKDESMHSRKSFENWEKSKKQKPTAWSDLCACL